MGSGAGRRGGCGAALKGASAPRGDAAAAACGYHFTIGLARPGVREWSGIIIKFISHVKLSYRRDVFSLSLVVENLM
jgi:hypothetical protein